LHLANNTFGEFRNFSTSCGNVYQFCKNENERCSRGPRRQRRQRPATACQTKPPEAPGRDPGIATIATGAAAIFSLQSLLRLHGEEGLLLVHRRPQRQRRPVLAQTKCPELKRTCRLYLSEGICPVQSFKYTVEGFNISPLPISS